jgi:hypothetical protein
MLRSIRGTVRAWEGCVVLDVESPPPATLAEAIARGDTARGLSEILLETGINTGPVDVEFEVLPTEPVEPAEPAYHGTPDEPTAGNTAWEDVWEDLDLLLPPGRAVLHGPGEAEVLGLGRIESPTHYRFRVYATGRDRMRDMVATEVVERYLVQAWQSG